MYTKIPDLAYEIHGDCVNLEQDCGVGEVDRVTMHPIHVRLIASEMGLLQGDSDAWRRVEMLERRMRVLADRIDRMDDMVRAAAAKGHEDLEVECAFSFASWELATEFCMDLGPEPGVVLALPGVAAGRPAQGSLLPEGGQ